MKPWLETVLSAIGSPSKNRFSPISTIFGFIKIDYETPPPFCPKSLFALQLGKKQWRKVAADGRGESGAR